MNNDLPFHYQSLRVFPLRFKNVALRQHPQICKRKYNKKENTRHRMYKCNDIYI